MQITILRDLATVKEFDDFVICFLASIGNKIPYSNDKYGWAGIRT